MAARKKRSISMPPELDRQVQDAARRAEMTYSARLASVARKEFALEAGLEAVREYERQHGPFSPDELADADRWAGEAVSRGKRSGSRRRRSA